MFERRKMYLWKENKNIEYKYFIINHICPTFSGEPTPVSTEKTVVNAEHADAKWAWSANTTSCCAENVSERVPTSSASPKPDEMIYVRYIDTNFHCSKHWCSWFLSTSLSLVHLRKPSDVHISLVIILRSLSHLVKIRSKDLLLLIFSFSIKPSTFYFPHMVLFMLLS